MSDQPVCTRCVYAISPEARYCARCGRALIPPPARLATSTGRWFDNLSPRYLSLDGLLARFPNRMYNPRLTGQSIVQPGRQTYDVLRRVSGFDGGL